MLFPVRRFSACWGQSIAFVVLEPDLQLTSADFLVVV